MKEENRKTSADRGGPPAGPRDFEIRPLGDYLTMIRERWFLGLAGALLVAGGVGYLLWNQPPVYRSEATLLVERHGERVVDMPQVVDTELDGTGGMWRVSLENHLNELSSRSFIYYVESSFTDEERARIVAPYLPDDENEAPPTVASILSWAEVDNVPNSFLLRVRMAHRDPEAAALIADRYVERYLMFVRDRKVSGNQAAIRFLTDQAEELRSRVEEAERELQDYRQQHILVSAQENQSLIAQRLRDINTNLITAQVERMDLEARLRQVEEFRDSDRNLLELRDVSGLGSTPQMVDTLDKLRQEREVMGERYLERHPRMVENERAIAAAERSMRDNIDLAVADLRSRLHNVREKEWALRGELEVAERESLRLDRLTIEYTVLQRAAEGARRTHAQILDRLHQTTITSQLQATNMRIVDRAVPSGRPVEPNRIKVAMLVAFLGGFIFVGAPIGLALMDRRMKGAVDVEVFLGQHLVGEIPSVRRRKSEERGHIVERELDDRASEAFRGLFSQMQLSSDDIFPTSILATSTIPGEGKSFLVSNLGFCFAAHGKRTLLIDMDLRRPTLHRTYDLPNDAGLIHWMKSECDPREDPLKCDALGIEEVAPNLFILRAGGRTKKATEIINDPKVKVLLAALKKRFDLLLIDTPPLGIFPDALAAARHADEAIYVVRFGKAERGQVRNFIGRLAETNARMHGVVLNGMPSGGGSAHYYSGYGGRNYKYAKYYADAA
jgi:polysaccharide biosynthesis transport protein